MKPRAIKRSHADKLARRKAADSLLRVRRLKAFGLSTNAAVAQATGERIRARIGARPFLKAKDEKAVMRRIDKAFLPRQRKPAVQEGKDFAARRRIVQSLFGGAPKFGLIVAGPEVYHQAGEISDYMRLRGFLPAFSKTVVLSKKDFFAIYPQTTEYRKKYFSFPVFAAARMSGPSKVIVFRWPTKKEVSAFAESVGAGRERGEPSKALKGNLRERFAVANLKKHGLWKGRKGMDSVMKAFDATGFIEKKGLKGKDALVLLDGIHSPDAKELQKDALALLSLVDLQKLKGIEGN